MTIGPSQTLPTLPTLFLTVHSMRGSLPDVMDSKLDALLPARFAT